MRHTAIRQIASIMAFAVVDPKDLFLPVRDPIRTEDDLLLSLECRPLLSSFRQLLTSLQTGER